MAALFTIMSFIGNLIIFYGVKIFILSQVMKCMVKIGHYFCIILFNFVPKFFTCSVTPCMLPKCYFVSITWLMIDEESCFI